MKYTCPQPFVCVKFRYACWSGQTGYDVMRWHQKSLLDDQLEELMQVSHKSNKFISTKVKEERQRTFQD